MVESVKGSEPIFKGFISLNFLFAVLAVGAFAYFAYSSNQVSMIETGEGQGLSPEEATLCSESVLKEIDDSEPMKLLKAGKADDALAAATTLYNADRYNARNCIIAGDVYTSSADKAVQDKGYDLLRKAIFLCPRSRFLRLNFARQLVKLNRLEEATREYDKLCQGFKEWLAPRLELAAVFQGLQQPTDAEKPIQQAAKIEPENPDVLKLLGTVQADLGLAAKDDAKIKTGFENYSKAFEFERTEKYPIAEREMVVANQGSIDKTANDLRKQLAAKKDDTDAAIALADLLIFQNQPQEAKDVLLTAEKSAAHDPRILRLKAEVLHLLGDKEGAFSSFKGAAGFDSDVGSSN